MVASAKVRQLLKCCVTVFCDEQIGDEIWIEEHRPISKRKRFMVHVCADVFVPVACCYASECFWFANPKISLLTDAHHLHIAGPRVR